MSKYTIYSTKQDYEQKYAELQKIEDTFANGHLDWEKIKKANMDNLDMIISIIKRQVAKGSIELKNNNIVVQRTKTRDVDSVNIDVLNNNVLIANGHYNIRTNFAHITMIKENQLLEDEIVNGIENRTFELN